MKLQLSRAHFPVTTLGPGRRIGIWFQGCHVRCPGCITRDSWESGSEKAIEVDALLAWCCYAARDAPLGVTISGGEPFEQPEALGALLLGFHELRQWLDLPLDILCFSGLPLLQLERDHSDLLRLLDALIPEPYLENLPRGKIWRGSANQPLVLLSPLGRARYSTYVDKDQEFGGTLQVSFPRGEVHWIGVPDRGDFDRFEVAVRGRGLELRDASWALR